MANTETVGPATAQLITDLTKLIIAQATPHDVWYGKP